MKYNSFYFTCSGMILLHGREQELRKGSLSPLLPKLSWSEVGVNSVPDLSTLASTLEIRESSEQGVR